MEESPAPSVASVATGDERARLSSLDLDLSAVEVPKASDILAGHLRRQILGGELPEGTLLPVERVLAATTGLSRGTVREALRILEVEGLLEIRRGRSGGSVVRRPGIQPLERSLDGLVRGHRIRLSEVLELRESLEPSAARLAAAKRLDEELEELELLTRRLEEAVDDIDRYLELNLGWHLLVARLSHNTLIHAFMSALSNVIEQGTDFPEINADETRALALAAHRRVVEAIRAGDEERAERAMRRHVHAFRAAVEARLSPEEVTLEDDPPPLATVARPGGDATGAEDGPGPDRLSPAPAGRPSPRGTRRRLAPPPR